MTTVAVIPGDGIGPEVVGPALDVLDALGLGVRTDVLDHVNARTYLRTGAAMTGDDLDRVRRSGATLLGAVGDPRLSGTGYVRGVLTTLRAELDVYVNYRPARLWHDRLSPLRDPARRAVDCVIVRENTEGLYSGIGGGSRAGTPHEIAIDVDLNTRRGVSRVLEFAFSVARRSVCLVDKANAVRNGGRLWQRCWSEAVARYPHVEASHLYVDTAAMRLATDPAAFDVIVTSNSYGDILSDLAAALAGGIGMAASANLNPATGQGLFEPVHGSAPDIAGTGTANPLGAILSVALLAEHLGRAEEADAVRRAVAAAVAAGRVTADLGGSLSTGEAGGAVLAELGQPAGRARTRRRNHRLGEDG
ncbi:isocitrate/isopropylmalate dehydrogenase family protein [Streptomyces spongiicola]|uniref:Isocitrate/isopropylmalate dehydrogenase family protein n=1 Tax=Streptomyces spongiicola TaxID=1690221 RepID=A0A2S1Z9U7_9ACTN|nr:isocitrate/isopropylmalate family dehydrogenase [Streptomyces spongiicola]AWK13136.1 isocitrate/isopropylmalate dehydrogenase family protein [Streptomyces spongiicola]GBP98743.1 isocitrate/isopropylmalate dehydrogenase family protein [Streptomyces spongiicola]